MKCISTRILYPYDIHFKLMRAELEVKKHNFPKGISAAGAVRPLVPALVRHWLVQHMLPKREQH